MFNLYAGNECLETAVLEKDVPSAIAAWESLGWEKVESRPMVQVPAFRSVEEIRAEKEREEFPANPTERDIETLEYFGGE